MRTADAFALAAAAAAGHHRGRKRTTAGVDLDQGCGAVDLFVGFWEVTSLGIGSRDLGPWVPAPNRDRGLFYSDQVHLNTDQKIS